MRRTYLIITLILITFVYWVLCVNTQVHISRYYELSMEGLIVLINLFGNFFLCLAYALDWEDGYKKSKPDYNRSKV